MMPSDAYLRFFSPTLSYPVSWRVSVPKMLLRFVINFLLLPFYPTGACPCLHEFLAVQHVSVLHVHFLYTFPYVVLFGLPAPHTP